MATLDEIRTSADAAYAAFLAIENQLPIEDRIGRTDSRYFADRREEGQYFAQRAASTQKETT